MFQRLKVVPTGLRSSGSYRDAQAPQCSPSPASPRRRGAARRSLTRTATRSPPHRYMLSHYGITLDRPETSEWISGACGLDTPFERTHGFQVDGVSPTTATVPGGWENRLIPVCNANTNEVTGWCLGGAPHRSREVLRSPPQGPPVPSASRWSAPWLARSSARNAKRQNRAPPSTARPPAPESRDTGTACGETQFLNVRFHIVDQPVHPHPSRRRSRMRFAMCFCSRWSSSRPLRGHPWMSPVTPSSFARRTGAVHR